MCFIVRVYVKLRECTCSCGASLRARSDQADALLPYDLGMSTVFAIDYFLRWAAVDSRLSYPLTPMAIVDFLTTVPVFIEVIGRAAESD